MQIKLFISAIFAFLITHSAGAQKTDTTMCNIKDTVKNNKQRIPSTSRIQLQGVTISSHPPAFQRLTDKTVINVDSHINSAGASVLEVLQKTPGIQMGQEGQILVNGKSGATVLIDGKTTYLSPEDLAALLGSMQASGVKSIEIMTNPPARYDAGGAAIINIIRKKNNKEGFNGVLNATGQQGHYGAYNAGITLSYKHAWYNISLSNSYTLKKEYFNRTVTSNILDKRHHLLTKQVSVNNNIRTNRSYLPSLALDFYLPRKITVSLSGNAAWLSTPNITNAVMDILDGNNIKIHREDFTGITGAKPFNFATSLHVEKQLDTSGQQLSIDVDFPGYTNRPKQWNTTLVKDTTGKPTDATTIFLDQYRKLHIYVAKADYTLPLKHQVRITTGVKFSYVNARNASSFYQVVNQQTQLDSAQSNYSINTEQVNAAYFNYSREMSKLSLQLGLRAEQTVMQGKQIASGRDLKPTYFQLFPTLFLRYQLDGKQDLIARLGRRVERAAYAEMVPFKQPLTPTLYFQGNPDLRPQTSYHAELGWNWDRCLFVTLSYDAFHDYIRTIPYLDSNQTTITRIPTNIPGVHSWSADIAFSKKINRWWALNYDLQVYQNTFRGVVNDFRIDNNGIVSGTFQADNDFLLSDRLSVAAMFEYNSSRAFVTSTFGPYSVLGLGVKYLVWQGKGTLSLNGNNLLQSEGHNAIDHYESLDQYSYWRFYTRSVRLSVAYRFGAGKIRKARSTGAEEEQNRAGN